MGSHVDAAIATGQIVVGDGKKGYTVVKLNRHRQSRPIEPVDVDALLTPQPKRSRTGPKAARRVKMAELRPTFDPSPRRKQK